MSAFIQASITFTSIMHGRKLAFCILFLLLKITYAHASAKQNHLVSEQWELKDMPFLSIIFAKSEYLSDGSCKEDTQRFLHDLLNGSAWAVQMFDSSTKYPEGILYGHTKHLGNFDECYNLQVNIAEENANTREINGKYCLVDIKYEKKHATLIHQKLSISKYHNDSFDEPNSFWKMIKQMEDFLHVRRNRLQLAICVPATCNAQIVETALSIPLEKLGADKNIELQTTIQPGSCQTAKEALKYTLGAGIYCAALLTLLILVIISTWYDYTLSEDGNNMSMMRNIMLNFSARRNYKRILYVNYTNTGLDYIYFIRTVTCIFIVFLHNLIPYILNPTINAVDIEKIYEILFITIMVNATSIITIFFTLSGIMLTIKLLEDLDCYKQHNFVRNIALRYLRLSPLYATIICFYIWIFPLLGSGPFWNLMVQESAYCAKNWWANLLYINNYITYTEMCADHSWYLAADFQLYVCSQFVIYAFWCMPRKIGYLFLGILTLISCVTLFVATYIYGASSIVRFTPYATEEAIKLQIQMIYIKGHMCAIGYLVGIITGAILYDHKGSTWRLSKFWSHILVYPLPVVLYFSTQYWAYKFFISNESNLLEEAFYAFFQRLVSAFSVCSTIVSLSVGSNLNFYYRIFTPRWIQPLANLSYGVYLIHWLFVIYDLREPRTARTFRIFKSIWDAIPIIIFSFLISLLLTICIEMPFMNLTKQLFSENNKNIVKRISENKIKKKE